jgi:hypothetical protein
VLLSDGDLHVNAFAYLVQHLKVLVDTGDKDAEPHPKTGRTDTLFGQELLNERPQRLLGFGQWRFGRSSFLQSYISHFATGESPQ